MDFPEYEEAKAHVDELSRPALTFLALLCAHKKLGEPQDLSLHQVSGFNTPWGAAPRSKEEECFQDLVWIHKVLPPTEKFNPDKAKRGYYRDLKVKVMDEFWSNYDPEQDKQIKFKKTYTPRSYPKTHNTKKPPSTLKAIRKHLAEGNHDF